MKPQCLYILSGLSGSGKSAAAKTFEDMGFFCVDNLPLKLIPVFLDLIRRSGGGPDRVALVIDIREGTFLRGIPKLLEGLRASIPEVQVLFFDATDAVLVRRFSETRRPHPLPGATSVEDGIAREREVLKPFQERADRVIDTSRFNVHELKTYLSDTFSGVETPTLFVSVESFGYKHGLPTDADLIFDVRFVPNPHFVDHLRSKSGMDREVVEFLEAKPEYREFCAKIEDLLGFLLPHYVREGKSYLTVAIGCTGGRHRSVAVAERLGARLREQEYRTRINHRDVFKE